MKILFSKNFANSSFEFNSLWTLRKIVSCKEEASIFHGRFSYEKKSMTLLAM